MQIILKATSGDLPGIDRATPGAAARPVHESKDTASLKAAIANPVAGQDTRLRDPKLLNS